MKKGILLVGFMLVFTLIGTAQKNQDFIISLTKDTIFGKVYLHDAPKVTFKHQRKKIQFHPSSIGYFGIYEDGQYQMYKSIKNAKGFAAVVKVLSEGKLKLYEYKKKYNFQNPTSSSTYMIGFSDDKLFTLSTAYFNAVIKGLIEDEPSILTQLATTEYQKIPELVNAYNKLQQEGELVALNTERIFNEK